MQEIDTQDYARQLLELHGDKAVVVAAEKASSFEKNGNSKEAKTWRHIEAALKLMRGPHQRSKAWTLMKMQTSTARGQAADFDVQSCGEVLLGPLA